MATQINNIVRKEKAMARAAEKGASWLKSKYAEWILAGIAFAESMFAPVLIDPFLVALILARREFWKRFVMISVIASVIGGLAGYAVGAIFFDTIGSQIVSFFNLNDQFVKISQSIDTNGFVFVLIGAFTPIPYKIVAIASGLLHINIFTFIVASIFGRFFRLGLVGFAAYAVGPRALPVMQRNLHILAAIMGVILIAYIIFRLLA